MPNGAKRSPDVSWILLDRWNALTVEQQDSFPPLCPDFVMELQSPSDSLKMTHKKMDEYKEQGIKLGWLIDPESKTVTIYRQNSPLEVLQSPTVLFGEDVLPGFNLALNQILY